MANHFANEMAVVTPNGKVLAHGGALREGLEKWRKLPEGERKKLEDLGKPDPPLEPAPPAGGLILAVFARPLARDGSGELGIYRQDRAHLSQEPGRDHVWLTEREWRSLLPAAAGTGDRVDVPAPLVDRLCRRYLIDLVRIGGEGGPRRPEDVVKQALHLIVEEAPADQLRLRIEGTAIFRTRGKEFGVLAAEGRMDSFQIVGRLVANRKAGTVTRFDLVALCETGHYDEIGRKVQPLGVSFELTQGERPADRVRPHSFGADYFGKGK
jgi:hypothetical protein